MSDMLTGGASFRENAARHSEAYQRRLREGDFGAKVPDLSSAYHQLDQQRATAAAEAAQEQPPAEIPEWVIATLPPNDPRRIDQKRRIINKG